MHSLLNKVLLLLLLLPPSLAFPAVSPAGIPGGGAGNLAHQPQPAPPKQPPAAQEPAPPAKPAAALAPAPAPPLPGLMLPSPIPAVPASNPQLGPPSRLYLLRKFWRMECYSSCHKFFVTLH